MAAAAKVTLAPVHWELRKFYILTTVIISFLIVCAPSLYNSDFLVLLTLCLLAALLLTGTFATFLAGKNLLRSNQRRSLAWLLLACLNFAGWWVNYRISRAAMELPLSPDDPALSDLLRWTFAPYFSS
jgi:hypothetical protein